ncbi:hypothetical protein FB563_6292 [Streptomyces puniciscabiei]|uniref:Uncharacterized protein n=1 Tax=Streptomyces puniciscabiei TaxID=164348 RepID=A0A542TH90_9ACTN|nr:hypothetical protein [Streptomyces puniciscabiei]TQK86193.1 hypothetical protein FB563_6292 [Streptomyces puniciscabiei]
MNDVLPKLDQLPFSSVESVLVESVAVTDAVVRAGGSYDRRTGGLSGMWMSVRANTRLLPPVPS